jgi:hypothetical protein
MRALSDSFYWAIPVSIERAASCQGCGGLTHVKGGFFYELNQLDKKTPVLYLGA